jgi:hypothetical protein
MEKKGVVHNGSEQEFREEKVSGEETAPKQENPDFRDGENPEARDAQH